MKTIRIIRDFDYHATRKYLVAYRAGTIVERVPEAAVEAILAAKAGEVVENGDTDEDVSEQPKPKRGAKRK